MLLHKVRYVCYINVFVCIYMNVFACPLVLVAPIAGGHSGEFLCAPEVQVCRQRRINWRIDINIISECVSRESLLSRVVALN